MPRPLRLGDGRSPLSHQRSLPVLCSPGHLGKPGTRPCPPWSAAPRHKLESGTRGDSLGRRVGLARAQQVPVLFSRSAPDDHSPAVKCGHRSPWCGPQSHFYSSPFLPCQPALAWVIMCLHPRTARLLLLSSTLLCVCRMPLVPHGY